MSVKHKVISKGIEARNKLIEGAEYLADCVQPTLGKFGQNWFLEKGNKVTNDGVTIAREIEHKDEIINRGIKAVREAAIRTCDQVGDATTSAIALTRSILKEAVKKLAKSEQVMGQISPAELIKKIEAERVEVTEMLKSMVTPIETEEDLINSALVSVEDETLGRLIGSTQFTLGKDGIIIAEESNDKECSVKPVTGVRIDNGLGTSLIMNNQEKQMLDITGAKVILTNYTFSDLKPIAALLEQLVNLGHKRVVLVARAFTNAAIQTCMENIRNGVEIYPINAPYTNQGEIMRDLVSVLGGRYINEEDSSLSDIQLSDIGYIERLQARRYDAIFTGADTQIAKDRVLERLKVLKEKHKGAESEFERKGLEERISQLQNGFAILSVGATSELERNRLKDKADDAVMAVRAAFQEGTVPGAGLAFKTISEKLPEGYILKRPLMVIYEQIMSSAPKGFVIEDWVRDPYKVLRIALENACSVAGTLATAAGATATERDMPLDQMFRRSAQE